MSFKYIPLSLVFLLTACSSTKVHEIPHQAIAIKGSIIAKDDHIELVEIPSHGAIGDSIAISADGGGNAEALRSTLVQLSNKGGGGIVVTSRNTELSKAVIEGAIKSGIGNVKNVTLIYAGSQQYSDELELIVKKSGMKYGFIDIISKM